MYQDPAGELTNEDEFNYNASTNTLAVENITGTTVTGSGVVKGSNTFGQRYATQAATNRAAADTASITVERYFTVTAEGNGESFNIQSNTPSAGNKIVRKIWYKDEAFEDSDVDTWTLLHTFADDTAYASTATKWQEYLDGQANGTPPFTLAISWEEQTLFIGLLDTYSGAAAAYSLRLLDKDYTGSAVRVRRASDNTEQDIGFDVNGDLDTSALTTFCTGTDGFIRTWYDQSGNNDDAAQTTTANQWKIYDSSTGVSTRSGKNTILRGASTNVLGTANVGTIAQPIDVFSVQSVDSGAGTARVWRVQTNSINVLIRESNNDIQLTAGVNLFSTVISPAPDNGNLRVLSTLIHGASSKINFDATQVASGDAGAGTINGLVDLGGLSTTQLVEAFSELILYPSDQSANRTGIESNISTYYGI
jgi:hypothetical protein